MHENNIIKVSGRLVDEPSQSHKVYDETFYKFQIRVRRLSRIDDILPVTISERLLDKKLVPEEFLTIRGQIRSYNTYSQMDNKTKLILTIFARHINFGDETEDDEENTFTNSGENIYMEPNTSYWDNNIINFVPHDDYIIGSGNPNEVFLNGYVCKKPVYRKTPFGREITDILLAVNRSYNKSDYIPCIAWGRNAKFAAKLNIADNINLHGRMQSRKYQKKMADGTLKDKIAYELSINKIELGKVNEEK